MNSLGALIGFLKLHGILRQRGHGYHPSTGSRFPGATPQIARVRRMGASIMCLWLKARFTTKGSVPHTPERRPKLEAERSFSRNPGQGTVPATGLPQACHLRLFEVNLALEVGS